MEHKLIPLEEAEKIYARPDGWHYHLSKECPMLQGGDFERLGYVGVTAAQVKRRNLSPCVCAYVGFTPRSCKVV